MTGPKDRHGNTRPISVAELLAKNGTIGAPPVGGRRRRRRGNSDSVTVAELTGELPIVSGHDVDEVKAEAAAELEAESAAAEPEAESAEAESAEDEYDDLVDDDYANAVAD